MSGRFELTDAEYARIAPLLPSMAPQRGGRWREHRQVINGTLFRVRTGVPWRDVPERYGPWKTLYKRFARWEQDGTWARIEAAFRAVATRYDKPGSRYRATVPPCRSPTSSSGYAPSPIATNRCDAVTISLDTRHRMPRKWRDGGTPTVNTDVPHRLVLHGVAFMTEELF